METRLLPLFPLNTVLFPGMPLPLHIFEERYRSMIGECAEREQPFGVVLIKSGQEVGEPAEPREVGTTATIAALTRLDDGRMNLVAVGQQRFRIEELQQVRPYLAAQVSLLEDEGDDVAASDLAATVVPALKEYLDGLFAMLDQPREPVDLPTAAGRLSYIAAAILQVSLEEKQTLLELNSTCERLRLAHDFLRRENEKLTAALRVKDRMDVATPFDVESRRKYLSPN